MNPLPKRGMRGKGGEVGILKGWEVGEISNNAKEIKGTIQVKRGGNRECKRREVGGLDSPAPPYLREVSVS